MIRDLQFSLVALACIGLTAMFIHHTRFGRYGLEAHAKLQNRLDLVDVQTSRLESVRARLRRDIKLLSQDPPDPDLTEDIAQSALGYAYPQDRIIVTQVP